MIKESGNNSSNISPSALHELIRGKSIARTLLNTQLPPYLADLKGRVLDIGGGSGSYEQFLPKEEITFLRTDITSINIDSRVDMNEKFPYEDHSFDVVLFFNALYIARDPRSTLGEVHRVLKPKGTLLLVTPYVMTEMREPHDYARFTSEGIQKLLQDSGFTSIQIKKLGERFTSAAHLVDGFGFRIFRIGSYYLARGFDRMLPEHIQAEHPAPISYLTRATA